MNFDFIIIGGSFAGMTTALALTQVSPDLKIAIIEKQDILKQDRKRDGRAYAISAASLKLFKEIGIYDAVQAEAGKISDIKITDYKSPFFLDFLGRDVSELSSEKRNAFLTSERAKAMPLAPARVVSESNLSDEKSDEAKTETILGQIIENYHIHNALRDQILQRKNITVFAPNFYQEISFANGVTVKLGDGQIINAKLLLACDGRISRLRELYQIHTTQKKYGQTAIVFNIEHQLPHENIAHEKFLPGGPLAILPLKNQYQSSIVWIAPDQKAQAILELDEENFTAQLVKKMENCLGKTKVVSEKFSYPLILIEAEKFFHEKMLLIGDAAAGVHPIAGQGFNLAISGINILCAEVRNNLSCGLDIGGQNLIDAYNKKAKYEAKKMLIATDILNSLFEIKSFSIALARDLGLGLVNKMPSLKKFFIKSAGGF